MNLTATQIAELMNREGLATIPVRGKNNDPAAFRVEVRIVDVAQSYGRTRVRVVPADGQGEAWIDRTAVELHPVKPVRCETCQEPATIQVEAIGCHFCASCLAKIDERLNQLAEEGSV